MAQRRGNSWWCRQPHQATGICWPGGTAVPAASTITVRVDAAPVILLGATPARHGNASDARLTLTGAGFLPGSTVQLVAGNGTLYPLAGMTIDSPPMSAVGGQGRCRPGCTACG
ncbi:MAG: hypothetical protein U0736_10275 [Gemmataceae bacterium]